MRLITEGDFQDDKFEKSFRLDLLELCDFYQDDEQIGARVRGEKGYLHQKEKDFEKLEGEEAADTDNQF